MEYEARINEEAGVAAKKRGGVWVVVLGLYPVDGPAATDATIYLSEFPFAKQKDAQLGVEYLKVFAGHVKKIAPEEHELATSVRDAHNSAADEVDEKLTKSPAFDVIADVMGTWVDRLAKIEAPAEQASTKAEDHLGGQWIQPITKDLAIEHAHRQHFLLYRKKTRTAALRMVGPFTVETSEGTVTCEDGFLAIDSRGFPYPIDREEFETIYEQVQ